MQQFTRYFFVKYTFVFFAMAAITARSATAQQVQWWPERELVWRTSAAVGVLGLTYAVHLNNVIAPTQNQVDFAAYQGLPKWKQQWVGPRHQSWERASDVLVVGALALPVVYGAMESDRMANNWARYAEMMAYTATLTVAVKSLVLAPRPYAYQNQIDQPAMLLDGDAGNSFFSGHSALAFAAAGHMYFYAKRNQTLSKWQRLAFPIAGTALAAGAAFGRVAAHKHFPHDVLVGAGVGWSMAWAFHKMQRKSQPMGFFATPVRGGWVSGFQVAF